MLLVNALSYIETRSAKIRWFRTHRLHSRIVGYSFIAPSSKDGSWCLGVMAYANGATSMITKDGGAFKAVLYARNFVLTIQRMSLNGQSVAHIEPREHPLPTATILADDAWKNLLRFGHTFKQDEGLAWPLYCNIETPVDPPTEYSTGQWDEKLRSGFMDASINKLAEERLRHVIHRLSTAWARCCGDVGAYDHYKIAQDKRVLEEHRRYDEMENCVLARRHPN